MRRLLSAFRAISRVRAPLAAALLILVCLVNLFFAATRFVAPVKFGNDSISRHDRILREVRNALGPESPSLVGYITDHPLSEWSPSDVGTFYQTQYGLAPIVVRQDPGTERFVVARFQTVPSNDPRLTGLALVHDFGEGILLFQRRSN